MNQTKHNRIRPNGPIGTNGPKGPNKSKEDQIRQNRTEWEWVGRIGEDQMDRLKLNKTD